MEEDGSQGAYRMYLVVNVDGVCGLSERAQERTRVTLGLFPARNRKQLVLRFDKETRTYLNDPLQLTTNTQTNHPLYLPTPSHPIYHDAFQDWLPEHSSLESRGRCAVEEWPNSAL